MKKIYLFAFVVMTFLTHNTVGQYVNITKYADFFGCQNDQEGNNGFCNTEKCQITSLSDHCIIRLDQPIYVASILVEIDGNVYPMTIKDNTGEIIGIYSAGRPETFQVNRVIESINFDFEVADGAEIISFVFFDEVQTFKSVEIQGTLQSGSLIDRDNNAYYLDPSSTTILNSLDVRGTFNIAGLDFSNEIISKKFTDDDNNTYYLDPSSTSNLGPVRFNNNDRRIYGSSRNSRNTVVVDGHWDELEIKGRVIDWSGSNLHIGFDRNHASHAIIMGENVGTTIFYSGGGKTETMRISNNNRVGIGIEDPKQKLDVNGNILFNDKSLMASYVGANNIDHIWHADASVDGAPGTWHFVSDKSIKQAGSSRLNAGHVYMTGSNSTNYFAGKLGIGVNPASEKLEVNGNIKATAGKDFTYLDFSNQESTGLSPTDGMLMYDKNFYQAGESGGGFFVNDGGGLSIYNEENGWAALLSTKNMDNLKANFFSARIGGGSFNNCTDCKLSVNGRIKAEGISVVVNAAADYVFDSAYVLNSLDSVKLYIHENGHLPNIPKADEIQENGWDVGDMSNKLLEKVEELTLYMIELKEENETLKGRIEELEARLED